MKKRIKYAGIAAAVLLTVAPVATPVVGLTTQTVSAADTNDDLATKEEKAALSTLSTFYKDAQLDKSDFAALNLDQVSVKYGQQMKYTDLKGLTAFSKLKTAGLALDEDAEAALSDKEAVAEDSKNGTSAKDAVTSNIKYIITAVIDGKEVKESDSYSTLLEDVTANGGTVKFTIKAVNTAKYNADKGTGIIGKKVLTVTNTNETKPTDEVTNLSTFTFDTPYHVAAGSRTANVKIKESISLKATYQGKEVKGASATVESNLYKSEKAAKAALITNNKVTRSDNDEFTDAKFGQEPATYYQVVTLNAGNKVNLQTSIQNNQDGKDDYGVTINGVAAQDYQVVKNNADKDSIKAIRAITVGEADKPAKDEWKTEDVNGVITVGDKTATLFNSKLGKATRGLAAGTGWITTMKRTNAKTGEVQYRVSTDEWMNEKDGKYVAKDTNTDNGANEGKLINVKKYNETHIVSLQNKNYVYSLYTRDLELSKRGLAGDSAWQCDRTAQDSEGTTYYRVSTNEWVAAGEGVSFK